MTREPPDPDTATEAGRDERSPDRPLPPPPPPPAAPAAPPVAPARARRRLAGVAAAAVTVAVIGVAVVLGRRLAPAEAPAPAAAVGACFLYTGDGDARRVDRLVACEDAHDGRVLAVAPGRGGCPAATDAVLTTDADPDGRGDVLCVDER